MNRKKRSISAAKRAVKRSSHPYVAKLKLLRHAHTGRLVHRQHTSYPILMTLLVVTGFFVFVGYDISAADSSGTINVGITVPTDPPSQGAMITSPKKNAVFKTAIIDVEGTCSITSEVVIYSNNVLVGTTLCTTASTFQLKIQLFGGVNKLTALNYDGMNQAGPITPSVTVRYVAPPNTGSSVPVLPIVVPGVTPTPPAACAQKPAADACHLTYATMCDNYNSGKSMPVSTEVRVAIVCMVRHANIDGETTIGVLVWGGGPPYALTVNWGDGSSDLVKSVEKPGYFTVSKRYASKGQYVIELNVSDKNSKQSYMQAMIDVAGPDKPNDFMEYIGKSINTSWFDSPVPTYFLAVAVVIGFWAGDYFERTILLAGRSRGRGRRHA